MPRFAHVIFDLDGTLVDTKEDLAVATNAMLAALGLSQLSLEQVTSYVGNGARVLVERALGPSHTDLVSQGVTLFMEYYQIHLLERTRPYPGIVPILTEARENGITLSVLTNKPVAVSRTILAGLSFAEFFAAIVGGDTLAVRKPHPQGVRYLQQHTGIPLAETLLVGDSRVDIETGQAAGVPTCGVTWGFDAQAVLAQPPEFVVDTPEELGRLMLKTKT
ncbi:MAG: phosphoglycolate phosphatase [Candidatus Binatia bacterium]